MQTLRSTSIVMLLLTACGGPPTVQRTGTLRARPRLARAPSTTACAEIAPSTTPRACVIATLDAEAQQLSVRFEVDPGAFVDDGAPVELRFDPAPAFVGETPTVLGAALGDAASGGATPPEAIAAARTVEYVIALSDEAPRARASWRRPGGHHLSGASFVPQLVQAGRTLELPATLVLDAGEAPVWTAAGTEQRVFDAERLGRLATESYELGALSTTRREVRSTTVWVATSGEESLGRLEASADGVERAIEALGALLGAPSTDAVLVTFHPLEGERAERLGASVAHLGGLPADPVFGLARASVHELAHLWIPGSHDVHEAWLAEGVTEYLAVLALEEMAGFGPRETARVVAGRHLRYAQQGMGHTLLEAGAADGEANGETDVPRHVVDGGLAAAYCIDTQLRASGSSLGAVLSEMLEGDGRELGAEAMLSELAAVDPRAASALEAMLVTSDTFTLDACLQRAGFRAQVETFDGLDDATLLADVLGGARELRRYDAVLGLEVVAVEEGSELEPGDVIVAIDDTPVGSLDEVAFSLRHRTATETFTLRFRRAGVAQSIERTLPSAPRAPRTVLDIAPADR